jgi:nucleotide-binding universal stress UspA family protein
MNILLAADGSAYTKRAARYLVQHLADFSRKPTIHVLHVHSPLPYPGVAANVSRKALERYQREECEAVLDKATKELKKGRLDATTAWSVGDVATQVNAYVKRHDIDLLVMGSHGHGALANLVLGSTATKILATSKVPVLLVR